MRKLQQLIALVLLCASPLFAQDEIPTRLTNQNRMGPLPYSTSVGSDIEQVDLATGALSVHIPIWSVPGRGMDASLSFHWNSNYLMAAARTDSLGRTTFVYNIARDSGWQSNHPYFTSANTVGQCSEGILNGQPARNVIWNTNHIYYDEDGGQHPLALLVGGGNCAPGAITDNTDLTASGMWGHTAPFGITTADGTSVAAPTAIQLNPLIAYNGMYKDANGNTRSSNTDTLGRPLYTAIDAPFDANQRPTQTTFTVTDPNGQSQNIVVVWQPLTITTHFATSGVIEANGLLWYAISSITFQNGTSYHFKYEPDYGELTEIDLPSGGVIQYTWANYSYPNPSSATPDQESRRYVASRKETVNEVSHIWTFQLSPDAHTGYDDSLVTFPPVQTPSGGTFQNQSSFVTFQGNVLNAKIYNGPATGTPLREYFMNYIWDGDPSVDDECNLSDVGPGFSMPMGVRMKRLITVLENGQATKKDFTLDQFNYTYYPYHCSTKAAASQPVTFSASRGNVIEMDEYGFGTVTGTLNAMDVSGAPLLRTTTRTYLHDSNPAYVTANIVDKIASEVVTDNVNNLTASQLQIIYDQTPIISTPSLGNVPAHDATFTSTFTTRGNPTSVQRWNNADGTWLTTTYNLDDLGNIRSIVDPKGNPTTWVYNDSFDAATNTCAPQSNSFAYVSKKTDAAGHNFFVTRRACTGQVDSHQDDNDVNNSRPGTLYAYDSMGRPLSVRVLDASSQVLSQTTNTYNDTVLPLSSTKTVSAAPDPDIIQDTIFDGLHRVSQTVLHDPEGNDLVDTGYDAYGRVATVSNPHRATFSATDGTTSTVYDALGRPLVVTRPDGAVAATSYSGTCTTTSDEAGKQRKACADALGRVTNVWEDPAGLNFETDYQVDVLGNLLRVDQKGSAPADSSKWRTRLFTYDSLSRLLSAQNPESGKITYTYDLNGNVRTKTAPAPNQPAGSTATVTTNYQHDVLNRLTYESFSDGTYRGGFSYDETTSNSVGIPVANGIGRLTSSWEAWGGQGFSYDALGRPAQVRRAVGHSLDFFYTYNLAGALHTLKYPSGRLVTYTHNAAGHALTAEDAAGVQYVSNATYWPSGAQYQNWNPQIYFRTDFNNRLQIAGFYSDNGSTASYYLNKTYSYGAQNNGNVLSIFDNKDPNRTQNFTYDSLNRITAGSTTGSTGALAWGENYTIDAWANLQIAPMANKQNGGSFQCAGDANNRATCLSYDPAGNVTQNGSIGYTYDAGNMLKTVGAISYLYDADGNRFAKWNNGVPVKSYFYGANGEILAEGAGSSNLTAEYVYFNGKRVARADLPANTLHFYLSDRLNSTSMVVSSAGMIEEESDYSPFGTEYIVTGPGANVYKFTGKERDTESCGTGMCLDYFGARYYSSHMGRFTTPDWSSSPEPVPYAQLGDPQSLNLYGYVRNDPLSKTDPDGHCDIDVGGGKTEHHWGWCIWHTLGFYQTKPEQIATARWYEAEYYKQNNTPAKQQPHLTDEQVVNAYRNGAFAIHTDLDNAYNALGLFGTAYGVYRGGSGLAARDIDVKVDPQTGLVQPGRGVSVSADPASVQKFGGAYKVESVPPELEIIQRGGNPNHYEIAPREPMTLQRYQELLSQVKLTPAK